MHTACHAATDPDAAALEQLFDQLCDDLAGAPDLVIAYFTEGATAPAVDAIATINSTAPVLGTSSCQGVLTQKGAFGVADGEEAVALFGIHDPDGAYGTAYRPIGDDPAAAANDAIVAAMDDAGRSGELPELIVMHAVPGSEERVIAALTRLTGGHCPIVGGSAADDAIAGNWTVAAGADSGDAGLAVAVLYPSTSISTSFQSGYEPAGPSGIVTASGGRTIIELDGRPAAVVYDEWTDGLIGEAFEGDPVVLGQSTMFPLARRVGAVDVEGSSVPYYTLLHPERVTEDKGMALFADVAVGDELLLMTGTVDGLIARAGRVIDAARPAGAPIAGAIVIYCAGCRLAVDDGLPGVVDSINGATGGAPFIGAFTFGEQGCLLGGENQHGNLMISAGTIGSTG